MTDEPDPAGPAEGSEETRVTAAGRLRQHPGGPMTSWTPDASGGARREPGTLEQRAEARRRAGLRSVRGIPSLQAVGWTLFLLGGLVYVHALWATANDVLGGAASPEQVVSFGTVSLLQGTVGLALLVVGLLVGALFSFVPIRYEPPLVPGTLEYEVAAENVVSMRDRRRVIIWVGLLVFLLGVIVAAFPLKETVAGGDLYRLSLGDAGYRVHLLGFLLLAVGAALVLPLVIGQGSMERAAGLAEAALSEGRVRRADEAPSEAEGEAETDDESGPDRVASEEALGPVQTDDAAWNEPGSEERPR